MSITVSHVHEAAHALAAFEVGYSVTELIVRADLTGFTRWTRGRYPDRDSIAEARDELLLSLVGTEASRRWTLAWDPLPDSWGDQEDADAAAARLARLTGEGRSTLLDQGRARARGWVEDHVRDIGTLAEALSLAGDRLAGDECTEAIAAAFRGETWQRPEPIYDEPEPWTPEPAAEVPDDPEPAGVTFARLVAGRRGPLRFARFSDIGSLERALGRRDHWRATWARL